MELRLMLKFPGFLLVLTHSTEIKHTFKGSHIPPSELQPWLVNWVLRDHSLTAGWLEACHGPPMGPENGDSFFVQCETLRETISVFLFLCQFSSEGAKCVEVHIVRPTGNLAPTRELRLAGILPFASFTE